MDIQMLGIDGLEATKAILKVDNTIKVVACSGFDDANIKK
jgi:DNA-binding NarL/FixJ family response regulator